VMGVNNSDHKSRYYWLCPLYAFNCYSGSADLIKGVQVKPTTFGFERYLHRQDSGWLRTSPVSSYMVAFPESTPATGKPKSYFEYRYTDTHEHDITFLTDLITAFRLCHTGMVTPGPLVLAEYEDSTFFMYEPEDISPGTQVNPIWTDISKDGHMTFFLSEEYLLNQADVPKINKLFKKLLKFRNRTSKSSSLNIALRRFNSSYHGEFGDRLIDQMIAFESLYIGDDKELGYKLALRTAFFLTRDEDKRKTVFSDMKKAYDLRGSILHGSKKLEWPDLKHIIAKTEEYLRQSIKKFLILHENHSLDSFKKVKEKRLTKLDENVLSNGYLLDTE
jgi:hypothetical protein